ncbi:bifunctional DNA primase/polymerase [Salinispora arenicola]|uniref:bifunctional DNA primase/polymerase n=1 Tax=Salinispora arenicola TaxID=168697 RepID=UPI0016917F7A|nr:bifunctional DNA primase/polymerase [Salinispora arenicola]NIL59166.1 bifunctional DNA primase/polymerase [Salinispora arenicola]NIL63731.1 bifunctional DNA primase/polymerase [Salinispora arenicola]
MTGGHWIGASKALGRFVSVDLPYPHICEQTVAAEDTASGVPLQVARWEKARYCAACAHEKHQRHRRPIPDIPPAVMERTRAMSDNPLLTAALGHAARGWHVFPLRPDDKRPAFPDHTADDCTGRDPRCRAGHVGWEPRATTDPGRIRRAWTARPYGIGLACGPSHLVVVDLDTPKDGSAGPTGLDTLTGLARQHGTGINATYTVTTGRGGTHLYYRHPDDGPALRNTAGERGNGLGPMVDTRAHGGYVVAAGSTVAGRPYTVDLDTDPAPLPNWLAGLLTPAPLPPQRPVVVALPGGRERAFVRSAVERECARVTTAPDHHNDTLYVASVALGQLVAGGSLSADEAFTALEHAGISAGLRHRAVLATIASGFRAGARRPRTVAA